MPLTRLLGQRSNIVSTTSGHLLSRCSIGSDGDGQAAAHSVRRIPSATAPVIHSEDKHVWSDRRSYAVTEQVMPAVQPISDVRIFKIFIRIE